ncbi:unnamed protein product [Strongylus vulgaris]|uniref:Neurotransmitter-gated ion-channel ligand-binding domain-containing protein n=1 Tax=Strongylus vulgaris TaxID=40348 RepID=A0A3P7LIH9_STRVU|nr:unnamed protein product [Strongylus vulgaris]
MVSLILDKAVLDQIWLPDLYFANARTAYFHEVTVHNFNMFISPNGTIAYGTRKISPRNAEFYISMEN